MNRKILLTSIPILFATLFFILFQQTIASPKASIVVNSAVDTQSNDGECTLREAIINANNDNQSGSTDCAAGNGADEITFSVTTPATITLNAQLPVIIAGSIITVTGPGPKAEMLTINGGGSFRVFNVTTDGLLNIDMVTISGGAGYGAGLLTNGTTKVTNSWFKNNVTTQFHGAGIYNNGNLSIAQTTFSENQAVYGGGLYNDVGGNLKVLNSTFSGNSATNGGGGIYSGGILTITNSTLSENSATSGGGIYIYSGEVYLSNVILANSLTTVDCFNLGGMVHNNSGNLVEDGSCGFPSGGDPLLSLLGDNGGATLTQALLPGSPAINTAFQENCPPTDQRGITRPQGLGCDIGAFELQTDPSTPTPTLTSTLTPPSTSTSTPTLTPTTTSSSTLTPTSTATPTSTPSLTSTPTFFPTFLYLPVLLRPCLFPFSETEPNNNSSEADGPLCIYQDYLGMPMGDNWDYYFFTLPSAGTFTIDITNHPLASVNGAQVLLYFQSVSTGNLVGGPDLLPPYQLTYTGAAGTYYIVLFNDISKCDQVDCSQSYIVRVSSISP